MHVMPLCSSFSGNATNAELFSWEADSDIVTGKKPFEMRVLHAPLTTPQLLQTITAPYKIWLNLFDPKQYNPLLHHC
jgi:hypothetical protein